MTHPPASNQLPRGAAGLGAPAAVQHKSACVLQVVF